MTDIAIEYDASKAQKLFNTLKQNTANTRPLMVKIAEYLHKETMDTFKEEGRPKWTPLAKSTQKDRARHGYGAKSPILQRQRNLIRSITRQASQLEAVIGTNKEYARIHQLGGIINHPARQRNMHFKAYKAGSRKGKTLFSKEGSATFGKSAQGKAYTIRMPARPFLPTRLTIIQQGKIEDIILKEILKGAK